MFWKKENEEINESHVTVQTLNGIKEHVCPRCHLPLLKRPFDESMKTNGKYESQRYDYHCAICNQAFDRFSIEAN
jgi:hypothetical protein